MMDTEEKSFFESTRNVAEDYIRNRLWLLRLQVAEKSAQVISLVLTGLVVALLVFFVLLFLSIMAGYFFAQVTGSLFYGFGIVAGFYVLLLAAVLIFRKRFLNKYISDTVVKIFFDSIEEDEEAR